MPRPPKKTNRNSSWAPTKDICLWFRSSNSHHLSLFIVVRPIRSSRSMKRKNCVNLLRSAQLLGVEHMVSWLVVATHLKNITLSRMFIFLRNTNRIKEIISEVLESLRMEKKQNQTSLKKSTPQTFQDASHLEVCCNCFQHFFEGRLGCNIVGWMCLWPNRTYILQLKDCPASYIGLAWFTNNWLFQALSKTWVTWRTRSCWNASFNLNLIYIYIFLLVDEEIGILPSKIMIQWYDFFLVSPLQNIIQIGMFQHKIIEAWSTLSKELASSSFSASSRPPPSPTKKLMCLPCPPKTWLNLIIFSLQSGSSVSTAALQLLSDLIPRRSMKLQMKTRRQTMKVYISYSNSGILPTKLGSP